MTIAQRTHLYPSRTQKLSSVALMILGGRLPGKVGRCQLKNQYNSYWFVCSYPVVIAQRTHLYPSRTQKLSFVALMILGGRLPGKVGHCRLKWPYGQAVKTPPFHGGNPGSIPGRVTIICASGGIGRHARFRFWWETVGVQVPRRAPQFQQLS